MQKLQQAGVDCDRLATNPMDVRRKVEGVTFDVLRGQADQAIDACGKAVQQSPSELRYQYQLGRAYQFRDKKKAFEIFVALVKAEYPAAFDNMGGMYLGRDNDNALQLFLRGRDLDDADSMVSLADMIDKGTYAPDNPLAMKLDDRFHETGIDEARTMEPEVCWRIPRLRRAERGETSWQHGDKHLRWR
jgi:hypothetical protein